MKDITPEEATDIIKRCQKLAMVFGEARLLALLTNEPEVAKEARRLQDQCASSVRRWRNLLIEAQIRAAAQHGSR